MASYAVQGISANPGGGGEPTPGTIRLGGKDVTALGAGALRLMRRRIGMILQEYALVERLSVMENALSGGQRQRVGIARALIQNPDILLVDEPTASLDPKTSRQIMRLILELCRERGLAAIINIHDVPLAMQPVPRIVGLRAGEVVHDGLPAALDAARLTDIHGAEDWSGTTQDDDPAATPRRWTPPARGVCVALGLTSTQPAQSSKMNLHSARAD